MHHASLMPALVLHALCIDMTHEEMGMTNTGCVEGDRMRIDVRKRGDGEPQVSWIIDFSDESSIFVLRDKRAFKRVGLAAQVKALPADVRKDLVDKTKKGQRQAAAVKIAEVPGEATDDCVWYTMADGGQVARLCVKEFPKQVSSEVQRVARRVRDVQRKHKPLSLDGVPLLNVELPLYDAKGLIGAGKLVTRMRIPRANLPPLDMTFVYRTETLTASYFDVPEGFTQID